MTVPFGESAAFRVALLVALLVVLLVSQAAASALLPTGESAATGRAIGRAGFAYLSGIRTFAAAVLWNRLDPQYDLYYSDRGIAEEIWMLPVVRLVQTLDPQFVQAYYVASWVVARHGDATEGFRIAREGIRNNPRSGLLKSSYIQTMLLEDNTRVANGQPRIHVQEAVAQADAAVRPDTLWNDDAEKEEGYAVISATYRVAGLMEKAEAAKAVAATLGASAGAASVGGTGHDHDGDGTPDH